MRETYNLFLRYKLLTGNSYDEAKRRAIDQSTSVRVLVINKLLESGKLSKEKHQYLLQNVPDQAFSDSVGYYIRNDTKTKGARSPRKRSRLDDGELTSENAFHSESSISHHQTESDWTHMDMGLGMDKQEAFQNALSQMQQLESNGRMPTEAERATWTGILFDQCESAAELADLLNVLVSPAKDTYRSGTGFRPEKIIGSAFRMLQYWQQRSDNEYGRLKRSVADDILEDAERFRKIAPTARNKFDASGIVATIVKDVTEKKRNKLLGSIASMRRQLETYEKECTNLVNVIDDCDSKVTAFHQSKEHLSSDLKLSNFVNTFDQLMRNDTPLNVPSFWKDVRSEALDLYLNYSKLPSGDFDTNVHLFLKRLGTHQRVDNDSSTTGLSKDFGMIALSSLASEPPVPQSVTMPISNGIDESVHTANLGSLPKPVSSPTSSNAGVRQSASFHETASSTEAGGDLITRPLAIALLNNPSFMREMKAYLDGADSLNGIQFGDLVLTKENAQKLFLINWFSEAYFQAAARHS